MQDFTIAPSAASRMYYPFNPDCPPMPSDDPEAHKLMHCVDGKRGWKHWDKYGKTDLVDNPEWLKYLPRNEQGVVVLDRQAAVEVGFINSPVYQEELEDLYLSALRVSFERFRFDTQFFGGTGAFYTADGRIRGGGSSQSVLDVQNDLAARRLFASGGELVVGLANSLVWQFSGPNTFATNTLLDFTFVQPLLRAGGRAVVLERLTSSERALLANVRQMEMFRWGFYSRVVAGRALPPGPVVGGPGIPPPPQPVLNAGGYLGLLAEQVRIRNLQFNVAGLRVSLDQIEALYDAERLDRLQVDQAREALYRAQSQLLGTETVDYADRLDDYKLLLGLPPALEVQITDPLLSRFNLISPEMFQAQTALANVLTRFRDRAAPLPDDFAAILSSLDAQILGQLKAVEEDLAILEQALPRRREMLAALAGQPEVLAGIVSPSAYNVQALDARAAAVIAEYQEESRAILESLGELNDFRVKGAATPESREALIDLMEEMTPQLAEISLIQARARADAVLLPRIDLTPNEALRIAQCCRPDWMNARSALVDVWRQIEVASNALRSDLNLVFSGDINTVNNNPVDFRSSTGRLRMGVEFDAPLTRLAERNAYRAAQIAYFRALRDYYTFGDQVSGILRSELRELRRGLLDFEIRRAQVFNAIAQVEFTQARIRRPVPPGKGEVQVLSNTTARDLVQGFSALLNAQNSFVTTWINYEVQRLNLDFDLGTMQLDSRCMWMDPGAVDGAYARWLNENEPPLEPLPGMAPPLEVVPAPPAPPAPQPPVAPPQ